ncbi:hypothetical protein EV193_105317 [Herbihabitans rhizosphaerae]|uniref:Uncharacterized protein n=1 Tax=Herbihabitans rhizosphaerae TaxID=1872711 RepID=A0A4Q7KM64_9PSEU|nr:hypothetical protein [Herbihabitans rhizosphaerae]RZS37759.1 hypothetical protein EV193_105317 [Herbihabitans rhizosphaerae]
MTDPVQGLTGTLTSAIRGSGHLSEVLVAVRGGTELYIARSAEPIDSGATVLIVQVNPGRIVDVVPWTPIGNEMNWHGPGGEG